jgi:penicillin-insensitive murein endopeptidase
MDFGDDRPLDDGIADSALEPIRMPARPRHPPDGSRPHSRQPLPDFALPAARCANADGRPAQSRSLGQVTSGTLENPCQLPSSNPGVIAVSKNAYGTDETIALLQWAGAQMAQQFPASSPLVVGGIAKPEGGFYPPHKSHQSGRDVDIGYPRTDRGGLRRFELTQPGNLDTERLWSVLEAWLASGKLTFVFMDYELQAVLYQDLLEVGYSETQLEPLFQYPSGPTVPRGLIRHASGHADHFHVRFRCPQADKPQCID